MKEQIRDAALSLADQRKGAAVGELGTIASALRRAGTELSENSGLAGTAVNTIADRVDSISKSLDGKDLRGIMGDVEQFARRNPVAFVGGAVALGFIASRFLKSDANAVPPTDTPMELSGENELDSGTRYSSLPGSDVITDSPMIAGLAALAVGAIFGAIVPETNREHQLFGETKDRLREKATTAARQKVSETISAVSGGGGTQ